VFANEFIYIALISIVVEKSFKYFSQHLVPSLVLVPIIAIGEDKRMTRFLPFCSMYTFINLRRRQQNNWQRIRP
jgi:hypothetical protein